MSESTPQNHAQPPRWSSDDFREARLGPEISPPDRGLIGHMPIVATLLIVQGFLEILLGLLFLGVGAMFQWSGDKELENLKPMSFIMAAVSVPAILCGGFRILAGYWNLQFRQRMVGMVALGVGLMTLFTCYCAPTSIALAIYGLVVYLNEPVVAAFNLGAQGRTSTQIHAAFPRHR